MTMIFSADPNWAIGSDNKLLFKTKGDMKRFRELTMGKVVIMGRKTLLSFPGGRPLKGRINIVLSREKGLKIEGAIICSGIGALMEEIKKYPREDIYIIGGEQVYRQFMPYCKKALVTKWDKVAAKADSFMENLDENPGWRLADTSERYEENGIGYTFHTYYKLCK